MEYKPRWDEQFREMEWEKKERQRKSRNQKIYDKLDEFEKRIDQEKKAEEPLFKSPEDYWNNTQVTNYDPIVESVIRKINDRSLEGMKKYGVPMTRTDISTLEWLKHAQEEAMDLAVYLERLIQDYGK